MSLTFDAPGTPTVLTFTLTVTDAPGLPDPTPDEVVVTTEGHFTCRWSSGTSDPRSDQADLKAGRSGLADL